MEHAWRHLAEPAGTRIALVLTDTVGRAWRSGAVGHVLHAWGRSMPVAVVQTPARRLWSWDGLPTRLVKLPAPGVPNRWLHVAGAPRGPGWPCRCRACPPGGWRGWARLLTAPGSEWVKTTAALVATPLSPNLVGLVQRVLLPGSDLSARPR